MLDANATQRCHGSWNDVKNRYLGLRFNLKQKTHYGWARLNISCNPKNRRITALLTGYPYETIPNKPIVTGKTKGRMTWATSHNQVQRLSAHPHIARPVWVC
jgi:hypothetical protein